VRVLSTAALKKYNDGLGSEKYVDFLKAKASEESRKTAPTKGQTLELYEIMNVESVLGWLYSADAPSSYACCAWAE
jgi:hypothetical protein